MRGAIVCVVLLMGASATTAATECAFVVAKSPIAVPIYYDYAYGFLMDIEYVSPVGVLMEVSAPLGEGLTLGARGGYYRTRAEQEDGDVHTAMEAEGFQVQVLVAARAPALQGRLQLQGGMTLGYCGFLSWLKTHDPSAYDTDGTTSGLVQTFLVGLDIRITRRLALGVEGELAGLTLMEENYSLSDPQGTREIQRSYSTQRGGFNPGASIRLITSF